MDLNVFFRMDMFKKVIEINNKFLQDKKYIYINIWCLGCLPCLKEMPLLNTLAESWRRDLACVFVSAHTDKAVNSFIKNTNLRCDNFIFVNEMQNFIAGIFNELEVDNLVYPTHVVLDKKGNALAFLIGGFEKEEDAARLTGFIKNLK